MSRVFRRGKRQVSLVARAGAFVDSQQASSSLHSLTRRTNTKGDNHYIWYISYQVLGTTDCRNLVIVSVVDADPNMTRRRRSKRLLLN